MELLIFIACLAIGLPVLDFYTHERDSSDQPKTGWFKGGKRSGLRVYVDYATGVHYFKSHPFDRLHVRLNADGTPYTGK